MAFSMLHKLLFLCFLSFSLLIWTSNGETINCSKDESCECVENNACIMNCIGEDYCKSSSITLTCKTTQPCTIKCIGSAACGDAYIDGSQSTDFVLICNGKDACKGDKRIVCGSGDCSIKCIKREDGDTCNKRIDTNNARSFECTGTDCPTHWPHPYSPAPTSSPAHAQTPAPITHKPTPIPTMKPTKQPTSPPTYQPTSRPTVTPTRFPTKRPSHDPSQRPTHMPTPEPTAKPTLHPSNTPTHLPSNAPSSHPTKQPSQTPSKTPTQTPFRYPTFMATHGQALSVNVKTQSPSKTAVPMASIATINSTIDVALSSIKVVMFWRNESNLKLIFATLGTSFVCLCVCLIGMAIRQRWVFGQCYGREMAPRCGVYSHRISKIESDSEEEDPVYVEGLLQRANNDALSSFTTSFRRAIQMNEFNISVLRKHSNFGEMNQIQIDSTSEESLSDDVYNTAMVTTYGMDVGDVGEIYGDETDMMCENDDQDDIITEGKDVTDCQELMQEYITMS